MSGFCPVNPGLHHGMGISRSNVVEKVLFCKVSARHVERSSSKDRHAWCDRCSLHENLYFFRDQQQQQTPTCLAAVLDFCAPFSCSTHPCRCPCRWSTARIPTRMGSPERRLPACSTDTVVTGPPLSLPSISLGEESKKSRRFVVRGGVNKSGTVASGVRQFCTGLPLNRPSASLLQ